MSFLKRLFGKDTPSSPPPLDTESAEEMRWNQVHDARAAIFEANFGKLPQDILKLGDLLGLWPGGGLYVIPAPSLGSDAIIYTTFGLTNVDMPTDLTVADLQTTTSDGRIVSTEGTMKRRETLRPATAWPGYGYEMIVAARDDAEWPLWLLQWAVKAEMLKDADFRGRVEKYKGMTVEQVQIGEHESVNLLIAKAQAPLLTGFELANGQADLLVMTVITDDEMQWSKEHGRDALLAKLQSAGIGQFSVLDRASVVALPGAGTPLDFSHIKTREQMMALAETGALHKVLLFPAELGGEDIAHNWTFITGGAARMKDAVTDMVLQAANEGRINNLDVRSEYKGDSFVPSKIHVIATHSDKPGGLTKVIEIW
jgi:hypothetical protein